jgi:tetratricopeptide (TPR) repeat protein
MVYVFLIRSWLMALLLIVSAMLISGCASLKGGKRLSPVEQRDRALKIFKEGSDLLYLDSPQALNKFDEASAIDPSFFQAFYNAGVALEAMGKLKDAALRYEACLEVNKEQGSCLTNLLLVRAKTDELKRAHDLIHKYLEDYPNKAFALTAAAELAIYEKDYGRAEQLARAVIEREADNIQALYTMARIFYAQKRFSAAKWVVKNALELAPSHGGLYVLLGHINMALSHMHDALDAYEQAVKFQPNEEALENYGLLLLRLGKASEALPILKRLSLIRPDVARNYLHLGNAYFANHLFDESREAYLKVVELDPSFKDINLNLGMLYLNLKPKDLQDLDRFKVALDYFKSYLDQKTIPGDRLKEVEGYMDTIRQKIELLEYAAQAEKEAKEATEKVQEESLKKEKDAGSTNEEEVKPKADSEDTSQ